MKKKYYRFNVIYAGWSQEVPYTFEAKGPNDARKQFLMARARGGRSKWSGRSFTVPATSRLVFAGAVEDDDL